MTDAKKRAVAGGLLLIGCGWLAVMWLDWSRLLSFAATGRVEEYVLSRQIKLALSFIVALLVWTTGKAGLSVRDHRLMRMVFAVVFIADIIFYLGNYLVGIGVFSIAQIVLIVRNGTGLGSLWANGFRGKKIQILLTWAAAIVCANGILLKIIFVPYAADPMFPLIVAYSFLLCCSLWTGISTGSTGCLPQVNSWLVTAGVAMLYLGDVTVGLNLVLPRDRSYIISTSLTWGFYLPAITLFALSGYRWRVQPQN